MDWWRGLVVYSVTMLQGVERTIYKRPPFREGDYVEYIASGKQYTCKSLRYNEDTQEFECQVNEDITWRECKRFEKLYSKGARM